jgi:NitT/TauT family transport system substrate-binding protein
VILVLVLGGFYGCKQKEVEKPTELQKVRFATVPFIGEAASYVAYRNGYFEEEGLDVTLTYNDAGFQSLKNLFEGDADIITVAETPIVYTSFDKKKYTDFERGEFYIIGNIMHSDKINLVLARRDKGINSASDLKGKKVAVFRGTASDFFMDSFFILNGIKSSDVEIVNMDPPTMVSAIGKGEVDAIVCWQPHILNVQSKLGDNAIILPSENIYTASWLIIAMKDYAEKNPEILEKFLRAIIKAENFIAENREESISIHSEESGVDREIVAALWGDVIFDLSLDQALLTNLEDEARWAIKYELTDKTEVPNYLDYIYFDALEKVKPGAVTIAR